MSRFVLSACLLLLCVSGWTQTPSPPPATPPAPSVPAPNPPDAVTPTPTVPPPSAPPASELADTPFQRGVTAYRANDLTTALREMRQAVKENGRDAGAWRWLGFLLVQNREPREAVVPLTRALSLLEEAQKSAGKTQIVRADMADVHTHLGDALMASAASKADVERAVDSFRKAAQLAPTSLTFYNLGFAYTRTGHYDEAARAYRKSVALSPRDARSWRTWAGLGFALQKQGREKQAEAVEAYREATALNREEASLWVSLGTLQMERGAGFRSGATSALETARKLNPQNYAATVTLARAYAEADRFDEAGMLFAEATALPEAKDTQTQAMLFYNRGVVLARAKKLADAQGAYERALGLKPQYFDALVNLGFVLFEQKKTEDAIARFRQSLAVQPNSFLAWSNLGAALLQRKDLPGAVTAWRKAAQIQPKNYDARAVLADLLIGQERTDEAIAVYRQMAALSPQSALPMNALGLAYQKKNDTVGALGAFREAVRREPRNAAARNNLGVLLEKRSDLVAAIAEYKSALILDPNFADAKSNLARFGAQAASVKPSLSAGEKPTSVKSAPAKPAKTGKPSPSGKPAI